MARRGWVVVLGIVICGLGFGQGFTQAATNTATGLDRTKWSIRITPDEAAKQQGEKSGRDALIFRDGKLISTGCGRYGFTPSTYTANQSGSAWSFSTEQTSQKQGRTSWSGQVNGDTINGAMTWTKKNGSAVRYSFEGKRARPFWTKLTRLFCKAKT